MPLFREMSDDEKFRVLSQLDVKLTAIMEARVKLRDRRNVAILSSDEDFEIETQLLRLDQNASDIVGFKEALAASTRSLKPPSVEQLDEMRRRVQRIREINAKNETASGIMKTATEVIGKIPKKPT